MHADKHQRFFQIDTIILLFVARHAQITKNISLPYLTKEVSDEVDFLHANRHEGFLRIDTMIFAWDDKAFRKFPK